MLATPLEKEWRKVKRKEKALARKADRLSESRWRDELKEKVPQKVLSGLQGAFSKGLSLLFYKGTKIIEKTFDPQTLQQNYIASDQGVLSGTGRKELQRIRTVNTASQFSNLVVTTVEGIGLGGLGIGMPDIVIFLGMLLKGIYETGLRYGCRYDTPEEQLLILKMMEAAVCRGGDWYRCNAEVESLMAIPQKPDNIALKDQIKKTGEKLALDMLFAKFIQGFPVIGIVGGMVNPVYYKRMMEYVEVKYQKRYLRSVAKRKGICLK